VLRGAPAFAAKNELAGQLLAGPFLRRLGASFVERYAVLDSLADTEKLQAAARAGRLLVFFPEGTFRRRSGLAGFYLGAFKVAAEAGLPVVPAAIRGTRTMLRGEQWLPRWSPVSVEFADPILPAGKDFSAVVKLRDAVRNAILARCGEPDLGELTKPERALPKR
jgi:1-acyl-sn-glycerol-3-phosphate acyltransferase